MPQLPHQLQQLPKLTWGLMAAHMISLMFAVIVLQAAWQFQSKESAMAFYGVYHRHPVNQLIHFVGVPGILWSFFLFEAHLPLLSSQYFVIKGLPGGVPPHLLNWATLWFLFYVILYLSIDPIGTLLYLPFLYWAYASAIKLTYQDQFEATKKLVPSKDDNKTGNKRQPSWFGTGQMLKLAFYVHFGSWYAQVHLGHKVFEGAQPAVMQSLGGALSTAPLFAYYEGIWAVGLMKDYQQSVLRLVDEYTIELCESDQQVTLKACESLN